jgi:hypothetical protein
MKKVCLTISGIGTLLVCLPVMYRISQGDIINPASFFLWALLSLVCSIVLVHDKKGGYVLTIGYFFSDLAIATYAYNKSGRASFGWFEWFVIGLTLACISIYLKCALKGNLRPAVITNATACMIAGLPQIADSFRNPYQMSFVICGIYLAVSALNYYGEEKTLNGRLLPGLSIIYWIIMIIGIITSRWLH